MPRQVKSNDELRELEDADLAFADGLVAQGLAPKGAASMKRVLRVLGSSEADGIPGASGQGSPNSRRMGSPASSSNNKVDLSTMPRTWKEAESHASIRASMKPKVRRSPQRPKPSQKVGSDNDVADVKSSRKKKSLYATSRGPRREAQPAAPLSTQKSKRAKSTNTTALRDAVLRGDTSYIRTLLRSGDCDIDSEDRTNGSSLLHICAYNDSVEVADILIANGANVNHTNKNRECPLHWAASTDSAKIAQLLLDFGADMETTDDSGSTALMRAAAAGSPHVLAVLLSRAGDAAATDYDGFSSVDLLEQCLKVTMSKVTVGL